MVEFLRVVSKSSKIDYFLYSEKNALKFNNLIKFETLVSKDLPAFLVKFKYHPKSLQIHTTNRFDIPYSNKH